MNKHQSSNPKQRYYISKVNSITSNQLHYRNPYIVAWWSFTFPGFGHYMVGSYLWGFIFMSFEYMINTLANINTSIYFTMTGDFENAKEIINHRWFLLYIVTFVFAIWDSYRRAIGLNKTFDLAYRETKSIDPFHFSCVEINVLGKKLPWAAMVWAFLMPSIGYIYLQRLWAFLFGATWWFVVLYNSHMLEGVYFTAIGNFDEAKKILDPQWLLYLPSTYVFVIYNSYQFAVENNKHFKIYQSRYLKQEYQHTGLNCLFN